MSYRKQRMGAMPVLVAVLLLGLTVCLNASAEPRDDAAVVGIRLRLGWKFDNLRGCGATPPGVPHGPDIDLSFLGEVAQVGGKVTRFRVGDRVFDFTGFALGAHAT